MRNSRNRRPSRRILVLSAGIGLAAALVAWMGIETLTGPRYPGGCTAIAQNAGTTWRINYSEGQCVVMVNPVPVDTDPSVLAVTPELLNVDEVFRALVKSVRGQSADDTGEAVAVTHFLIDETGVVRQTRIAESSGHQGLDEAMLALAPLSSFSPAEGEEGPTGAWVAVKAGFRVSQPALRRLQQRLERWRGEAEM